MISEQFYSPCLPHDSYLIVDETAGTAAVVDPQRDNSERKLLVTPSERNRTVKEMVRSFTGNLLTMEWCRNQVMETVA